MFPLNTIIQDSGIDKEAMSVTYDIPFCISPNSYLRKEEIKSRTLIFHFLNLYHYLLENW